VPAPTSLLVAVLAGADPRRTRRQVEALRGLLGATDRILVLAGPTARTSGLAQPRTAVAAGTPAQRAHALVAAAADAGVVVLVEDHAVVADRRALDALRQAVEATGGPAVPATNAAPWPQSPLDVPDDDAERATVRAFARAVAAAPVEAELHDVAGPLVALPGATVAAIEPAALAAPLASDRAAAVAAAIAPGVAPTLAGAAYVHAADGAPLLSACLIVKDEAEFLPACLDSLRGLVDEVVVYDTGSTDGSIELAREWGAIVLEGYWDDDFARARNAALAACRGRWVVHIDADETIEDTARVAGPMRDHLRRNTRFDCVAVNLHNLEGSRLAAIRNVQGSLVSRFLRRTHMHWVGEIHEQPVARPGRPEARYVACDILTFLHAGYLPDVMAERGKHERNARIAEVAMASGDFPDAAKRQFDLGRSYTLVGRHTDAMDLFEAAAASAENPVFQRSALEFGAQTLLTLGRYDEAIEWAERLEARAPEMHVARLLKARAHMAAGRTDEALALVDGISDYNDRYSNNPPDGIAVFKALGLMRSGRPVEAAASCVDALRLNLLSPGAWPFLAAASEADPDGVAPLLGEAVALVGEDRLTAVLALVLHAVPAGTDHVLEALWARTGAATAVLACASDVAPKLDLERAAVWSARLRGAALAAVCPLRAIAADAARPPAERARSAALAAGRFDDDSVRADLEAAAALVDDDDVAALADEVLRLATHVADSFVVGAATTPARARALVRPLLAHGHPAEAVAVAGFVAALAGEVRAAAGVLAALSPDTVAELAGAAARLGRDDVVALLDPSVAA
jgi:tetratricopeptide (TPR) repeat protein